MKPEYTKRQKQAIDLRGCNILVSASAGAGKTSVLTERIVELVLDKEKPVDIDKIVVVTFTKAAAAEMKSRITDKLAARLKEDPDNPHLGKQIALIAHAQVTTIDSFCLNIVKNYFYTIDKDPVFRIGDKEEMDLIKNSVLKELLEDEYEKGDEAFIDMVETYAPGKSDEKVRDMILKLYNASQSHSWPEEWLTECLDSYDIDTPDDIVKKRWYRLSGLEEHIKNILGDSHKILCRASDMLKEEANDPDIAKVKDFIDDEADEIGKICEKGDYLTIGEALAEFKYQRFPSVRLKEEELKEIKDNAKALRDKSKDSIGKLKNDYYNGDLQSIVDDIKACGGPAKELIRVTIEFLRRFSEYKEEKKVYDFSDVEHDALKILIKRDAENDTTELTDTARELMSQYEYILIDEYQDSNEVQETILSSISRAPLGKQNIFMVGDIKQSIYQFRLAKPDIFEGKLSEYKNADVLKDGILPDDSCPGYKIFLKKNFRSTPTILNSVNYIFSNIMHKELGKIEYDETHYFDVDKDACTDQDEPVELLYVTGDEAYSEFNKKQLEAWTIVEKIKEITDEKNGMDIIDKNTGEKRKAVYSDIVILLRAMSGWAEDFVEMLTSKGIPAVAEERKGYFSAMEIQTLLSMLKIIDNPHQDIPLTAAMRSIYGGFDDEELVVIRKSAEGDMYDALCAAACGGEEYPDEELVLKCRNFVRLIERYRKKSSYITVYELIIGLFSEKDYLSSMKAMSAGARREGNLLTLADKALKYQETDSKGLSSFLRYIDNMIKVDIDFGEAKTGDGLFGTVRIMSIHQSKGLEFPVVFIAGMGKNINLMDSRNSHFIQSEIGFAPAYFDRIKRIKRPTLIKKATALKLNNDVLAEELRILYVAMTRAKLKLIMTGYLDDLENVMKSYANKYNSYAEMSGGNQCYFDWVSPCVLFVDGSKDNPGIFYKIVNADEFMKKESVNLISTAVRKENLIREASHVTTDNTIHDHIISDSEYEYPYKAETRYTLKMSVSEIKHRAAALEDEEAVKASWAATEHPEIIPSFMREDKEVQVSGADRGTMYHALMEYLDIENITTSDDIKNRIPDYIDEGILPEGAENIISTGRILAFCKSDVAGRMAEAQKKGNLSKEQPFVMGIPASEVYDGDKGEEIVLVQGIIDVFFEEEDGIVLLDYKTDSLKEGEEGKLVSRYKAQMNLYRKAIEKTHDKKVKEIILYSFSLNKEIGVYI